MKGKTHVSEQRAGARQVGIRRFALTYLLLMGAFFFVIGFTPLQRVIDINGGYTRCVAVNIVRIAGLAYAGMHFPGLFEYIHIYVAQGMMIAVALGVFFVYMGRVSPYEKHIL